MVNGNSACVWLNTYIDRADEVLVTSKEIGQGETKDDGENPGSKEAFDCLFGADFDELSTAKGDAADVGENIIRDDQGSWQEEPNHALEDVVHDKVGLHNNQVEGHVSPGELGELELVMTFLERGDEENEA